MAKSTTTILVTLSFLAFLTCILASIIVSESATTPFPRTVRKTVIRRRKLSNSSVVTTTPPSFTEPSIVTTTATLGVSVLYPNPTADFNSPTATTAAAITRSSWNSSRSRAENLTILTCDTPCNSNDCVRPHDCQTEMVLDHCSCCHVCAAVEGDLCYNTTLNLPFYAGMGICGSSLSCLLRNDLRPNELPEAQCQCRDTRVICGSDNITYSSECKLREAAHLKPNLTIQAWTPCPTEPWISELENTTAAVGEEISLSCEVRAFPWPVIHWQFLEESSSQLYTLPGDDPFVVVTIRGGPEPMMTSSWIQIISISPRRQGTYFCIASNSEGTARKQTYVSVYNNNNDDDGGTGTGTGGDVGQQQQNGNRNTQV